MTGTIPRSAFSRVSHFASLPAVHAAFQWFHLQERRVMQWQRDMVAIAAPPFGEEQRATWLAERFAELGLEGVEIDSEGNVLGCTRKRGPSDGPCVVLSAHIDTVFPRNTPLDPLLEDRRLSGPGACDNGAGVAGLLAVAAAIQTCGISPPGDLLFVGNVGEEGEGDLRGIRYLYQTSPWREQILANVILDGGGSDVAVTRALGSRRYQVTLEGPGGHSWTDAGTPNPVVVLSHAIAALSRVALPDSPRTTLNVGTFEGGSSVNSIPERAVARFDLRSLEPDELIRMEVALHRTVEDAVLAANEAAEQRPNGVPTRIQFDIAQIGNRPAGGLRHDASILEALRAVDRHLGIQTAERIASTDANIPLALGIPAIVIGAGGHGGGIHTRAEWYDSTGRDVALRRILLLLLATF